MTLDHAIKLVDECSARMNEKYGAVLFDEWIIVEMGKSDKILAHSGPRGEAIIQAFTRDLRAVGSALEGHDIPGDFGFTHEGHGSRFDAFVVLGKNIFLLWNKLGEATSQFTKNPSWKIAQIEFVALTDLVRNDPVEV